MGTTKTSITGGSNPDVAFVLAIEGEDNLVTSWHDSAAVVTAWGAPAYGSCVRGLKTPTTISQSISPFRPRIEAGTTTFVIVPDDNDETLIRRIHATDLATGDKEQLNATIDPGDSTIAAVDDVTDWTTPAGAYIGTERFAHSGTSGSSYTSVSRGVPVPFAKNGGTTWGRRHAVTQVAGGILGRPVISDYPRVWIGKYVGLWVHRVVDGVLDLQAQAEQIFAGRISDVSENEAGATVLSCTDVRDIVSDQMLLSDQWEGIIQEGIELATDDIFAYKVTYISDADPALVLDTGWQVMAVDGTYISAGLVTSEEFITAINEWKNDAGYPTDIDWLACGQFGDGTTNLAASITDESSPTNEVTSGRLHLRMTPQVAELLGFDIENPSSIHPGFPGRWQYDGADAAAVSDNVRCRITSKFAAAYCKKLPRVGVAINIADQFGTFINQGDSVPEPWKGDLPTTSNTWGFIRAENYVYLAQKAATTITPHYDEDMVRMFLADSPYDAGLPLDPGEAFYRKNSFLWRINEEIPRVRQIVLMAEPLMEQWLIKSFASTGETDYNHASYDKYDHQLGLAIPWDLLGDNFVNSATAMAADTDFKVLIEKPTKFGEILLPELALRNAHLVFRDGALMFARPAVIDATSATHTLTTSHKAARFDDAPRDWPHSEKSRNTVINVMKVEYLRDFKGAYHKTIAVHDEQSKTDHGQSEPLTIQARNSMQLRAGAADEETRALISDLAADALRFYKEPLLVVSRSVSADKWFMTPGDTVSFTDDYVRDPTTGSRGISAVPGWVLSIEQNWTTMIGEVQVVLHGDNQAAISTYAPAGLLDQDHAGTTDGYDVAGPYIWLEDNFFTLAAEDDDATHFEVDDVITIQERSPATPGSPVAWVRTVTAISGSRLTLSSTLSSPAFPGSGERYYVFADDYAASTSTQQIHCYLGDVTDGQIVDTVANRIYAGQPFETGTFTTGSTTDRIDAIPSDGSWADEGEPVHPASHRAAVVLGNNIINRKTAPQMPFVLTGTVATTATDYELALFPFRMHIGRGISDTYIRQLEIGPIMEMTAGAGTGKIRVTSSMYRPTCTDAIGSDMTVSFIGPKDQTEWSNTTESYVNVTPAMLNIVPAPTSEYTWITVEQTTSANTSTFYGFHAWWMGALGITP